LRISADSGREYLPQLLDSKWLSMGEQRGLDDAFQLSGIH